MSDTTPLIGSDAKNKHELVVWSDPFEKIWAGFTRSMAKKVTFDELMERGMFKFLCSAIPPICRGLHPPIESLASPNDSTDRETPGPKEQVKVMKSIVQMMKQLSCSPIDEVEMLLVLLALYK